MVSGKHLVTDFEDRKKKFVTAANNVLAKSIGYSEERIVEILVKQCLPIFKYSCGFVITGV